MKISLNFSRINTQECNFQIVWQGHFMFVLLSLSFVTLHCCMQALFSCGEQRLLFSVVHGLLIRFSCCRPQAQQLQCASLGHLGFSSCDTQTQQLQFAALVALQHVTSSHSWTRDQTHVPCISRQILIHCTTKEVHKSSFSFDRNC